MATATPRSITDRMIGALRLDDETYEEVEADTTATGQAGCQVLLASTSAGTEATVAWYWPSVGGGRKLVVGRRRSTSSGGVGSGARRRKRLPSRSNAR